MFTGRLARCFMPLECDVGCFQLVLAVDSSINWWAESYLVSDGLPSSSHEVHRDSGCALELKRQALQSERCTVVSSCDDIFSPSVQSHSCFTAAEGIFVADVSSVTYQNHDLSNAIVLSSTKYHMHDYYAKCTTLLIVILVWMFMHTDSMLSAF